MTDLSGAAPIDRWARSTRPERRCTAHRKNGDRCKNAARRGTNVCDFHGAKAPQVKRKARERLEEATDRLARELLSMATDPNVSESVRLSAIKDALDRRGVSAKTAVEVEVGPPKPWEQIMDGLAVIESGSRADFRRSRGVLDDFDCDPAAALAGRPRAVPPAEGEPIEAELDGYLEAELDGYQPPRNVHRHPAGGGREGATS
jgi:hypothetical protein